ncbi:hypothetical protein PybrP1_005843 [[Pythium] brassicae (nom. inval.)]|nr:hypothetical protein PybrP1_005843 [[Pythium] brassicae (nom. inval.)]
MASAVADHQADFEHQTCALQLHLETNPLQFHPPPVLMQLIASDKQRHVTAKSAKHQKYKTKNAEYLERKLESEIRQHYELENAQACAKWKQFHLQQTESRGALARRVEDEYRQLCRRIACSSESLSNHREAALRLHQASGWIQQERFNIQEAFTNQTKKIQSDFQCVMEQLDCEFEFERERILRSVAGADGPGARSTRMLHALQLTQGSNSTSGKHHQLDVSETQQRLDALLEQLRVLKETAETKRKEGMSWIGRQCAHLFSQLDCKEVEAKLALLIQQQHASESRALLVRIASMAAAKGECATTNTRNYEEEEDDLLAGPQTVLDEGDIALLKTYGIGPYTRVIKQVEDDIKKAQGVVNDLIGIKESDTGLSLPSQWDLVSDKQMMQEEQPLQVARCSKIINAGEEDAKYMINVKQIAKFVVGLGEKVAPTDIEEGMRVGVDRTKYAIQIPLPPKIDPTVSLMTVEDKPDVTYDEVGGAKDALEKLREVVELPLLHPERFLVQKYVGEGARMVRELFTMARSKKACIVFFDEIDAIGGARSSAEEGGTDNEVQRTMLQIVTELDGFDPRGNIKVLMATNRPDTLDPALMRPGRLDRKVEFNLPELDGRTQILKIHAKSMSCDRNIRFELIARLCPNTTGAELRSVCTEAGMFAIRARRKSVSEKDFLESVNKVIKGYQKFSSTPKYMVYN